MNTHSFSKSKPIIGLVLLLGILSVALLSTVYMDHEADAHHSCVGMSVGLKPCLNLTDITSCLQIHRGVLQAISQLIPTNLNQMLILFILVITLWFGGKWKQNKPGVLSKFHWWWPIMAASLHVLAKRIGRWLTIHEKRDPAPVAPMALWVLPALIV